MHLLSDFLRRYFGLIRRVTKSVTICHPPPPSSSSKRFRTRNRMQIVKNLNFLRLPKSNYSLTVKLRVFVNWFSPETALEVHLKLLQNSSSNRRGSLKKGQPLTLLFDLKHCFNASNFIIKCRAWKVLSDERNCIAIAQGRPEIHRFEVRCFEQKLDKLSRYLEVRC